MQVVVNAHVPTTLCGSFGHHARATEGIDKEGPLFRGANVSADLVDESRFRANVAEGHAAAPP
ncbi:hypothetical protein D9M68_889910 [compost metagenome]